MRAKNVVVGVLIASFALCGAFPARAENDPLTPLNDAFLAAIPDHRSRDALLLLKRGATARIRGFAAACRAGDFYVAKALVLSGVEIADTAVGSLGYIAALQIGQSPRLGEFLLTHGVNPNHQDVMEYTLRYGDLRLVQKCVATGGRLERLDITDSALAWAFDNETDGDAICMWLLKQGVSPNVVLPGGYTMAHLAAQANPTIGIKVLAALVEGGADLDARDEDGRTPLMEAARIGNQERVRWLLSHGADARSVDRFGANCLHLAFEQLRLELEVVDFETGKGGEASPILRGPPDRSVANDEIRAHFPVYLKITKLVCAAKAFDPSQRNSMGKSARDMAEDLGFSDAAQILARREAERTKRRKR